jgi:GH24 family phage-related lysozyme (muramidase)
MTCKGGISEKVKEFIKSFEGFSSKPSNDSEGYATIGIGYLIAYKSHTKVTKDDIAKTEITWEEYTNGISEKRALELFNKKIVLYEKAVQRDITVNLYQYEFDALVSLVFNTGQNFLNTKGAGGGDTKIKKNINAKNIQKEPMNLLMLPMGVLKD